MLSEGAEIGFVPLGRLPPSRVSNKSSAQRFACVLRPCQIVRGQVRSAKIMRLKPQFLAPTPFVVGAILGWLIWHTSPVVFGKIQPWDGSLIKYASLIIISGYVSAILRPRFHWFGPIGLALGQLVFLHFQLPSGLWLLPVLFCLLFSSTAFIGSSLAWIIAKDKNLERTGQRWRRR